MHNYPLISCVMPTYNRPKFVERALKCFLAQTYPNKELVILEDRIKTLTGDLLLYIKYHPDIRYFFNGPRQVISKKRNLVNSLSNGEFIAHWDDDDWSAPNRLEVQYNYIATGCDVVAFYSSIFYDEATNTSYVYQMDASSVVGGSLFYKKEVWENCKFDELTILGSDTDFWRKQDNRLAVDGVAYYIAHQHAACSNRRLMKTENGYRPLGVTSLPIEFIDSLKLLKAGPSPVGTRRV